MLLHSSPVGGSIFESFFFFFKITSVLARSLILTSCQSRSDPDQEIKPISLITNDDETLYEKSEV